MPGLHWPVPVPHAPPPPGLPLSIAPSQSSSRPLQSSTLLPVVSVQLITPFMHWNVPSLQRSASGPSHVAPVPDGLSSTMPLQLLSLRSHVSAVATPVPWHVMAPAVQRVTPVWQVPWSGPLSQVWEMPSQLHAAFTPVRSGSVLSIRPSQSLSRLSQISGCGTHGAVSPMVWIAMSSKSLSPPRYRSSNPK